MRKKYIHFIAGPQSEHIFVSRNPFAETVAFFNDALSLSQYGDEHVVPLHLPEEDPKTFKRLLEWINTDEINNTSDMTRPETIALYFLAEKWNLEGLGDLCFTIFTHSHFEDITGEHLHQTWKLCGQSGIRFFYCSEFLEKLDEENDGSLSYLESATDLNWAPQFLNDLFICRTAMENAIYNKYSEDWGWNRQDGRWMVTGRVLAYLQRGEMRVRGATY